MKNEKVQPSPAVAVPVITDEIKEVLHQAIMVVAYRAGDVNTEDGTYATTCTDSIIRLEEALCAALGTTYDDIDLDEAITLLNAMLSTPTPPSAETITCVKCNAEMGTVRACDICGEQPNSAAVEPSRLVPAKPPIEVLYKMAECDKKGDGTPVELCHDCGANFISRFEKAANASTDSGVE